MSWAVSTSAPECATHRVCRSVGGFDESFDLVDRLVARTLDLGFVIAVASGVTADPPFGAVPIERAFLTAAIPTGGTPVRERRRRALDGERTRAAQRTSGRLALQLPNRSQTPKADDPLDVTTVGGATPAKPLPG
jgi:hypothetical protein